MYSRLEQIIDILWALFCSIVIASLFIAGVTITVKLMTASNEVEFCTISGDQTTSTLTGVRSWRPEITLGKYPTTAAAVEAARSMNCKIGSAK